MASIEVFFGAVVFIFMLIGLVRGFLRELGVTTILMFLLFFLSQFEPQLDKGMVRVFAVGGRFLPLGNESLLKCIFFLFVIIATSFVSYEGETLAFGGQPLRGTQGITLGLLTGFMNGYLIAGSIWYYMHKFGYPLEFLGFSADKLSNLANSIVDFLPITFLGKPILFGQGLLLYLSALLFLARVIR